MKRIIKKNKKEIFRVFNIFLRRLEEKTQRWDCSHFHSPCKQIHKRKSNMSDKQDKKYEIILFAPFRVLNFIFHYIIALISSITNYPILEQRYRNLYNYIPTMNYNNAPPVSLNISDALNNLRNAISNHPSPATPIINSSAMRQSRSAQQLNQINNSIE